MSLSPLFKWSGGKSDEIKFFEKYIPPHDVYLEPFFGGGALYFYLKPKKAVISDIKFDITNFLSQIKEGKGEQIYGWMNDHPNEEEVYYKVRSMSGLTNFEQACQFYYLRKTCYRGMIRYNKSGGFNIPFGRYKTCNYEAVKNKDYISCLQNTTIRNCSFEEIFNDYNSTENFMFLDPPYDSKFSNYGNEFGENEHRKLAEMFKNTTIKCLMVIGRTEFTEELYSGYIKDKYAKKYKFRLHSNRIQSNDIDNEHLIITNY